jgi:NADH-quinone oxidoreductase subunit C
MTPHDIAAKVRTAAADAVVDAKLEGLPDPYLKIAPAHWHAVALLLRDEADLAFDYLMCLSGVDYTKGVLGVVVQLYSMTHRHRITLKVEVPAETPDVASIADVWPSANWHEREAYDMIGIRFTGHPDLRRILLPEDWDGHPLRKDYKIPEFYQGMKVPY